MRYLIVNADDFGFSPEINQGILDAFNNGIVTDTSILIHSPYAESGLQLAKEMGLPVGIHVDFVTEYVENHQRQKQEMIGPKGQLARELFNREMKKEVNHLFTSAELIVVRDELRDQVKTYLNLMGRKPSHLDYHFGLHYLPDIMAIYVTVAEEYDIPIRWGRQYAGHSPYKFAPRVFCDQFRGNENSSISDFLTLLDHPWHGVMEICCHPGYFTPQDLPDSYNQERVYELKILLDPKLKIELRHREIELVDYNWLYKRIRSGEWNFESGE